MNEACRPGTESRALQICAASRAVVGARRAGVGDTVEVHVDANGLRGARSGLLHRHEEPAVHGLERQPAEDLVLRVIEGPRAVGARDLQRPCRGAGVLQVLPGRVQLVDLEDHSRGDRVELFDRPVHGLGSAVKKHPGLAGPDVELLLVFLHLEKNLERSVLRAASQFDPTRSATSTTGVDPTSTSTVPPVCSTAVMSMMVLSSVIVWSR